MNKKFIFKILLLVILVVLFLAVFEKASANSQIYQEHYRWRADDGDETTAAWLSNEDTAYNGLVKGDTIRLRFTLYESYSSEAYPDHNISYATDTSGSWTLVPVDVASGEHFEMVTSNSVVDGESTTNQLSVVAGMDWQAGKIVEDPSNTTGVFTFGGDSFLEHEFCIKATENATAGQTYYFRMESSNYILSGAYHVFAQLTLAVNVSGIVYTDEGSTNIGANKTVALSVNGGTIADVDLFTAETDANGAYSIDLYLPSGAKAIAFLDGETEKGSVVSVASGGDQAGFNIYQNHIIVRNDNGGTTANTDLDSADNGDADIQYSVSGTALTLESGTTLYVMADSNYAPGGTISAVNFKQVGGIYTGGSSAMTLSGNLAVTGGAFSAGSQALNLTDTANQDINSNGGAIGLITVNKASGNVTFSGNMDATGIDVDSCDNIDFGDSLMHAWGSDGMVMDHTGTVDLGTGTTHTITGGVFDQRDIGGTLDDATSLIVFEGTCSWIGHASGRSLYDVTVATGASVTLTVGRGYVDHTMTINGTFSVNGVKFGVLSTATGTVFGSSGVLTGSSLISLYSGIAAFPVGARITADAISFYATGTDTIPSGTYEAGTVLILNHTGNPDTLQIEAGTTIFTGNVKLWAPQVGRSIKLDLATNTPTVTVNGNLTIDIDDSTGDVILDASSNALTVQGDIINQIIVAGTFAADSQDLTLSGTSDQDIDPCDGMWGKLTLNKTGGDVTLTGNWTGSEFDFDDGDFDADTFNIDLSGDCILDNDTTSMGSGAWTIGGSWDSEDVSTFNGDTSTLTLDASSGTESITSNGSSFNNLILNDGGGTAVFQLEDGLDVNGNLTITGGTLDANSTGNNSINLGGDWINNDIFSAYLGTLTLDGTLQTVSGSSDTTFYNLTKSITSADTLTFVTTPTITISNNTTLKGVLNNLLSLRSNSSGVQNNIDISSAGTRDIEYVDVQDNNQTDSTVIPCSTGCTDSGNNTGWDFVQTAPSDLTSLNQTADSITWNWNDNSDDEDGFKMYDGDNNALIETISANATSYEETGLSSGTFYTRYLVAYNTAGNSLQSNTTRTTTKEGGGGPSAPPASYSPPSSPSSSSRNPQGGFNAIINKGNKKTTVNKIILELFVGKDTKKMAISNTPDFLAGTGQIAFQKDYLWNLCFDLADPDRQCEPGEYTIYIKFFTKYGVSSATIISKIILEEKVPIVEKIKEIIPKIPGFIKKIPEIIKEKLKPEPEKPLEETLSKEAPVSLRGEWSLLAEGPIKEFILSPLPKEIRELAGKFPQLEKTFEKIGISKITDIERLRYAKLTLPGLTETLGLKSAEIETGKLVLPQGVPIAQLSFQAKQKLPTDIIFVKTAGELIDFNISLTVTEKGQPEQKITGLVNKPLQLVVKPDSPVKSVKGYVIFKSKPKTQESESESYLPSDSLLASAMFAVPSLTKEHTPAEVETRLVLLEFEYTDLDNDGIYTAEILAPQVEGEYEIITVMDYQDPKKGMKEIRLITVIDPEGYVYAGVKDQELRIAGAVISLFWLNPGTKQYELWPAEEYQQENPQMTNQTGTYSFLVPEGSYYLKVEAPGYLTYKGKSFQVEEGGGIHKNIELKVKYWWLKLIDWRTIIIILVLILLLYNFYRDRIREKLLKVKK